jgi:hypothetical protein
MIGSPGLFFWGCVSLVTILVGWVGARWRARQAHSLDRMIRRADRREAARTAADTHMDAFRGGPR